MPTTLEFTIAQSGLTIRQDGVVLATSPLSAPLAKKLSEAGVFRKIRWGDGIYGPHSGPSLTGRIETR